MQKTELFDFSFVNRNHQQKIFKRFISNFNKEILWINGNSGVGKSEFIKYMLSQNEQYTFVYYLVMENNKSEDVLKGFIQELQKEGAFNFGDFIQKEYKRFYNTLSSTTITITKTFGANISEIVSAILDITNYVVTKNEERRESIDVIRKYIENVLNNKMLFICIDNFSKCNEDIMVLFLNVFKPFLNDEKCKICIITTDEDMNDEKKLKIRETVSSTSICIEGFKEYRYFWEIMDPIFEMKNFSSEDIKYLSSKCQGKPHNLSIIISKLLDHQGILCDTTRKKAYIYKNVLQEILKAESIKYNENNFSSIQQLILFSFLCLYQGVEIKIVKELAMYISTRNILYMGFTENKFHEELLELIRDNKLCTDGVILETCHDSDYIDYVDIFKRSPIYQIISQHAYEFILCHEALNMHEDLICRHMREAKIEKWEERNFLYGKKLFESHLYYDAEKVFSPLLNMADSLSENQLLLIAINEYNAGYYDIAIKIFSEIDIQKLASPYYKFYLLFYWGKSIYNSIGDVPKAISKLTESTNHVSDTSEEYVNVQNLLQMLYFELPGNYDKALAIFNNIQNNYKTTQPKAWASTMRGCHNFIKEKEVALKLLVEACACTDDELEHAYIDTTRGFVYVRAGELDNAKQYFEKAYIAIKHMKIHESSYAANNLAVCNMIENKYPEAKELLLEGLFWNRTNYGKIVLHVHLMICDIFLGNTLEAEKYYNFLTDLIDNRTPQDEIILRKVLINLAIASKELGKPIQYSLYIEKAEKYVQKTSSEWRYHVIREITDAPEPENMYYRYSKFDPWFLVYAHD